MCTLSILPLEDGLLVAMNRDEALTRPLGGRVVRFRAGEAVVAHPVDVSAGGTWFGASSAGFVAAVLNNYQADDPWAERPWSRGRIPLLALTAPDPEQAAARLLAVDPSQYRPFRAILVAPLEPVLFVESDGRALRVERNPWGPRVFVSSGLDEPAVRAHREARFRELIERADRVEPAAEALRRLHFRQERPRSELGFSMWRPEARSVSYTELRARGGRATLYHLESPPVDYELQRAELDASALALTEP